MDARETAYVGLGANVGAAAETLEQAIVALAALPGVSLTGASRLYRTQPVGPVEQSEFLNAVAGLRVPAGADPELGAMALLIALKGIERALGRQERERWGPREIDLDLLVFGEHAMRVERAEAARSVDPARSGVQWLEVPHPEASRRLFVLAPLADLAPELQPPGWPSSVREARVRAAAVEGDDAVRAVGRWSPETGGWMDIPSAPAGD